MQIYSSNKKSGKIIKSGGGYDTGSSKFRLLNKCRSDGGS